MRVEYMKNMLIDRLIGLDYIYTGDFITKMKNYISDEEDIEKLKDLDGFVTDRVYLDYFKDNIQEKLDEHSMSIFEVKNMIKNNSREGVGEKESVYSGRDFSYRGGFNSGVVEKDIVRVEVADTYKSDDSCEEDEEDEIDIDLNDKDNEEEGFEEEDEIDIDLEEDDEDEVSIELEEDDNEEDDIDIDLEEDDSEEEEETGIDLGDDEDEIDIDLEEDNNEEDNNEEDDSEEEDEIDINLEEDEDDIDSDYEDNDFSGADSEEDDIDIDLEEEDEGGIDLEEDEDDSDDIDIDLEDGEDIDVDLEDEEEYNIDTTHSNTPKPKENKQQHENRVKEKVFNNNFSNNTWDILNGAVDGVSNFFKRK